MLVCSTKSAILVHIPTCLRNTEEIIAFDVQWLTSSVEKVAVVVCGLFV